MRAALLTGVRAGLSAYWCFLAGAAPLGIKWWCVPLLPRESWRAVNVKMNYAPGYLPPSAPPSSKG